ncbi:MAG: glycerol dehydrogenase [Epulopiscium sp. Nuni2H_MBin003]|nr:MAG: glycerol dehydrogenase [Epulopiscium sp. Nuni2H_MBin003]
MANTIISPSKYIQGRGELSNLGSYAKKYGKKPLVIISKSGKGRFENIISTSLEDNAVTPVYAIFNGEITFDEISRLEDIYSENDCDFVIGVGGGKIMDTAKVVSLNTKSAVIIIPTIASTNAPCSALSIIYTAEGIIQKVIFCLQNPNIVLVDTQIIVEAPIRLFVAGMGDALSAYFESRACIASGSNNFARGKATRAVQSLSKTCHEILMQDGYNAKVAVEQKVCTQAVENVIEANTYLSGVGFESGGLAAAHAVHDGLNKLAECHDFYHGEKVAFGVIVQLVLENAPELNEVIAFCKSVGLPTTLKELGIEKINHDDIKKVAEIATHPKQTIHSLPFKVTAADVYAAILVADSLSSN